MNVHSPVEVLPQYSDDLIVDLFAGGGGVSEAIKKAVGREPDVAINHAGPALAMHAANHPNTLHMQADVRAVDPLTVYPDRAVALLWLSPDCKHFSKAKGSKLLDRNIRDLAWAGAEWADKRRPRVIILENVDEFTTWGPVDEQGEPIKGFEGVLFDAYVKRLKQLGYKVQWRKSRKACDFGDPTIRQRFIMIARCDGEKIVWPKATHAKLKSPAVLRGVKKPHLSAGSIIDPNVPCPSIFATREEIFETYGVRSQRPPAPNTMYRIAQGIKRYVIDAKEPYFVNYAQHGGVNRSIKDPLHTITASSKDQNRVIVPEYVHADKIAAFMAQHNTGVVGRDMNEPLSTLTVRGTQQAVVSAFMLNLKGSKRQAYSMDKPLLSLTAQGGHACKVAALMIKYYGSSVAASLDEPLHTITTKDRFGLVTVELAGENYVIVDIGMRMLTPREQFRAHSFPDTYKIDPVYNGKPLAKSKQTGCVGNSVPVNLAAAHVGANFPLKKTSEAVL
ncbi:MAG: DNA cytosine methyltransferase [Lentilitoribacter sp.]